LFYHDAQSIFICLITVKTPSLSRNELSAGAKNLYNANGLRAKQILLRMVIMLY